MKWMRIAVAATTLAMAGSVSSLALAQVCRQACNNNYTQCLSNGKAQETCLAGWHQCKMSCGAKIAAYTPARTPVAAKPAAQAKAVIGKH